MPEYVIVLDRGLEGRLKLAPGEIDRMSREALEDIGRYVVAAAKSVAPRRSGNLVRNISTGQVHRSSRGLELSVGVTRQAPYGRSVEEGTGIYGPKGVPIRPVTGNFMVFEAGGKLIHARTVKGQRAQRYMRKGLEAAEASYIEPRLQKLALEVGNFIAPQIT